MDSFSGKSLSHDVIVENLVENCGCVIPAAFEPVSQKNKSVPMGFRPGEADFSGLAFWRPW